MKKWVFILFIAVLIGCTSKKEVSDAYILSVYNNQDQLFEEDGMPFGMKVLGLPEDRLTYLFALEVKAEEVRTTSGLQVRRTARKNNMELTFSEGKCNRVIFTLPKTQRTLEKAAAYSEKYKKKKEEGENYVYYYIGKKKNLELGIVFGTSTIQFGLIDLSL
jgi:hypothetical protein